ncbi:hypothetical protein GCM10027449_15390 [Sinomonas notoginsengisoli]
MWGPEGRDPAASDDYHPLNGAIFPVPGADRRHVPALPAASRAGIPSLCDLDRTGLRGAFLKAPLRANLSASGQTTGRRVERMSR